MKLPGSKNAAIAENKLRDYLLSDSHPVGQSKAQFFHSAGFDVSNTSQLEAELLTLAKTGKTSSVVSTAHGTKYVVDGVIHSPLGEKIQLRSIWIIEPGQSFPRLVTAYPL